MQDSTWNNTLHHIQPISTNCKDVQCMTTLYGTPCYITQHVTQQHLSRHHTIYGKTQHNTSTPLTEGRKYFFPTQHHTPVQQTMTQHKRWQHFVTRHKQPSATQRDTTQHNTRPQTYRNIRTCADIDTSGCNITHMRTHRNTTTSQRDTPRHSTDQSNNKQLNHNTSPSTATHGNVSRQKMHAFLETKS